MAKKKASKKVTPRKTAPQKPPQGFEEIKHADSWNPETIGEAIHFKTTAQIKEIPFRDGKRRVVEIETIDTGAKLALWENAGLRKLFETINERGIGGEYYVRFDGYGEPKLEGQDAPKLFTVMGKPVQSHNPF